MMQGWTGYGLDEGEGHKILDVLRCTPHSNGPQVEGFEKEAAKYLGMGLGGDNAVAVSSGTGGLEIAIEVLNKRHGTRDRGGFHGGEVIVPAASFTATALAVVRAGCTPVFVDIEPGWGTISWSSLQEAISDATVGVIAVDFYGFPVSNPRVVQEICKDKGLWLIEDACPAWGTGISLNRADAWVFSMNYTKIVGCGEGGLAIFGSAIDAMDARMWRNFGESDTGATQRASKYCGGNYKLTEVQACIARMELGKLEKRKLYAEKTVKGLNLVLNNTDGLSAPEPFDLEELDVEKVTPHKYRAVVRHGLLEDAYRCLEELGVPFNPIEVKPLNEHEAFGHRCSRHINGNNSRAKRFLNSTIVIGSRSLPIWGDVNSWETHIGSLSKFDREITGCQ